MQNCVHVEIYGLSSSLYCMTVRQYHDIVLCLHFWRVQLPESSRTWYRRPCTSVYTCMYTYSCTYTYHYDIHKHVYKYMQLHTHIQTCTNTQQHKHMHTRTHIHACTHKHVRIHLRLYIYIDTYTHTQHINLHVFRTFWSCICRSVVKSWRIDVINRYTIVHAFKPTQCIQQNYTNTHDISGQQIM